MRRQESCNPEPSAGLIDSPSVKTADTVGRDTRGYDAGKKVDGRKRFIVTDTLGLLLTVVVLSAVVQDQRRRQARPAAGLPAHAGAVRLRRWRVRRPAPGRAQTILRTTLHIVRKPADQRGYALIPRRWAVERTFAWLTAHRALARDDERYPARPRP